MTSMPGRQSSLPRSNRSFWTSSRAARTASGRSSQSSTPRLELSSSTSPMASMRRLSLVVRLPSPRPVVPASPVRVTILDRRLPLRSVSLLLTVLSLNGRDYTERPGLQTVAAMPKFAANRRCLFTDAPFHDRFKRAAAAGFQGVEYLFPYDWPAHDVAEWLKAADVEQVLFNLPPGDWAAGERGLACLPHRQGEFAESVARAMDYAVLLDCRRVHCMAGLRPPGADEAELEVVFVNNLRHAADQFATIGVTVMIEPINSRIDMPGYWLDDVHKGFRLLEAVDRSNVKLQLDLYHAQIIQGDLARTLESHLSRIGHIQVADNPGRHEPGTGEIHYPFLFALLDRLGYSGWVGCEYRPQTTTEAGLGWLPKWE